MAIRAEDIDDGLGSVDIDRDRVLVLRHQRGDVHAFDELYRRYHLRLVGYCQRRVGDRHIAEELAQEAFVKALRAMPGFAGERRFYPWLTVIAQRLCIDHHRRSARVEPAAQVDTGVVDADHDAVFAAVDRDHLGVALERLAPRHREILELREQRGWSYQQIASHLDVPMTTVEALLHRARKALRREFLAVAGDDRGGRFGVGLLGVGLIARVRNWLAAVGGPERWTPVVGTAAAGTLAIGLVAGPLTDSLHRDGADPTISTIATTAVTAPSTTAAAVEVVAGPPVTVAVPSTATAPRRHVPEAAADLGLVTVYTGDEATEWARDQNDQQPVQVPLGLVDIGLHPIQTLGDILGLLAPNAGANP